MCAVNTHHHTTPAGLLQCITYAANIIGAVGIAHNIQARREIKRVVGVEISAKDTYVEVAAEEVDMLSLFMSNHNLHMLNQRTYNI